MTGIEEFKNFFGGITILNVLEFGLAVAFLAFLYKKAKKYLIERHEAQVEKDQGLKKALEEVAKYPDYRKQSINVQNQLESEIGELRATIEANTQKLQQMENDQNRRERNKLRERLIQSYRFYTDLRRNPAQTWNRMEAEAFWETFGDYESLGGNGYVHTVVQPAMNLLQVVEVGELSGSVSETREKVQP